MKENILLNGIVLYPIVGALISYFIGRYSKAVRNYFADFVVISEFGLTLYAGYIYLKVGSYQAVIEGFAGFGLHFKLDGFRCIYLLVAALMWMMTTIFSREYLVHYQNRNRYYLFLLWTLGATVGVFLSQDLYTTFIFFEMMSFTSYVWVAHDETKEALRAAETYLAVAVIGGLVMLMGLFLLYMTTGTLEIAGLYDAGRAAVEQDPAAQSILYAAAICICIGFGAKAGAFPLHIWLPKAHPVAPAPTSALLSGILTKSGVFGILAISTGLLYADGNWGSAILLVGTITMFLGALLALFSINLKRTLACSSMSQIGFILVGIGMQGLLGAKSAIAASGTMLHMVNHSLIKLVLFMAAGVVYMNLHKLNLNEIRGFGRKKPLLHIIFLTGALAIMGVPGFSGYISKTMLHESIVEYTNLLREGEAAAGWFSINQMTAMEWIFLLSGGMTVAYMTKLYVAVFVEKNKDRREQQRFDEVKHYMNGQSSFALLGGVILLLLMGILPHLTMDQIAAFGIDFMKASPMKEEVTYFSLENLKGAVISIGMGILIYLFVVRALLMRVSKDVRIYVNRWPEKLDLENLLYRPAIHVACVIAKFFCRVADSLVDGIVVLLRKTIYCDRPMPVDWIEGNVFTYKIGRFLDGVEEWRDKHLATKKERIHHEYSHELALKYLAYKKNRKVIERTLSYGLFLFGAGFIFMVVYLLIAY